MYSLGRWSGLLILIGCISLVAAQDECPTIVETALNQVDELCQDAARNQACYGNVALTVEPQSGATDFVFEQQGDIVDVADIAKLELTPLDEAAGEWGMVLMRLQADIPDTLPGTNVTFLLFGDVTLENAATEDQAPMQAFYLQTGIGDAPCSEAPDSGVMIQTPDGVETVSFNINGVDVEIGSTVFFQAQPEQELTISPVEGAAVVELEGEAFSAIAGTSLRIPMDANLRPNGLPPLPESYSERDVQGLPTRLFERPIEIEPPLSAEGQTILHEVINQGLPPCGVDPLPPCINALDPKQDRPWAQGEGWGAALPPRQDLFPGLQNFQPAPPNGEGNPQLPNNGTPRFEGTPRFPVDGTPVFDGTRQPSLNRTPLFEGTPRFPVDGTRQPPLNVTPLFDGTRQPPLNGTPLFDGTRQPPLNVTPLFDGTRQPPLDSTPLLQGTPQAPINETPRPPLITTPQVPLITPLAPVNPPVVLTPVPPIGINPPPVGSNPPPPPPPPPGG